MLRTGGRVFLELGPPPKPDESGRKADEESEVETDQPHDTTPALLALAAGALLPAGLALPGLPHSMIAAAAHLADHSGYHRLVLPNNQSTPAVPSTRGPTTDSDLRRRRHDRRRCPLRRSPAAARGPALAGLRTVGVATIGGAFALTLC